MGEETISIATPPSKGYLTATDLARFHVHLCKKLLWLSHDQRKWKEQGAGATQQMNVLDRARFAKGNKWEERLQKRLEGKGLIWRGPGSRHISVGELIQMIKRDPRSHYYAVDISFAAPSFASHLEMRGWPVGAVAFGTFKPDFLEVWVERDANGVVSGFKWRIIDAKASKKVKISHQVQIGFYWLCLMELFQEWSEATAESDFIAITPDDIGSVWIPPSDATVITAAETPSLTGEFSLPMLRPLLENFLFEEVPRTLSKPVTKVPWHFNPLCRGCDFVNRCAGETVKEGRLGNIPNLSISDHTFLKDVAVGSGGLTDLEDLHRLVHSGGSGRGRDLGPGSWAKVSRLLNLQRGGHGKETIDLAACGIHESSVLRSATKHTVEPNLRRCLVFPREEDVGVYLSLGMDPERDLLFAYSIIGVDHSTDATLYSDQRVAGSETETFAVTFIESLASLIQILLSKKDANLEASNQAISALRVQFYVYASAEQTALAQILVAEATLQPGCSEATKLCIGALLNHSSVLLTTVQPELLSSQVLFRVQKTALVPEVKRYLRIFGGPDVSLVGNKETLLARLEGIINGSPKVTQETGLMRLMPKVAVLSDCVQWIISMPVPGWYTIEECFAHLVSPGATASQSVSSKQDMWADMYTLFKSNPSSAELKFLLEKHSRTMQAVSKALRHSVESACQSSGKPIESVLPNVAREFEVLFIDVCRDLELRRLLFMCQYEIMTQLESLIKSRLSNTHNTHLTLHSHLGGSEYVFTPTSGTEYLDVAPSSSAWAPYGYLLTRADSDAALEFDDLAWAGVVGLRIGGGEGWGVAEVAGWDDAGRVTIKVRAPRNVMRDGAFVLSRRMVDFNTLKLIKTILTIDHDTQESPDSPPFFTRLLHGSPDIDLPLSAQKDQAAEERLQRFYREYYTLVGGEKALLFVGSQRKAFRAVLGRRVSVVWGPPGHGKTHTLALSALRLIELTGRRSDSPQPFRILVTASTNNAVETLIGKLASLLQHVKSIDNMQRGEWRDHVATLILSKEKSKMPDPATLPPYAVVGATVWGVHTWRDKYAHKSPISTHFSSLIIDEGSQMTVSEAAIPIDAVMRGPDVDAKRLIVAGDHLQLAPVLQGAYPVSSGRLFGSVLEWLVDVTASEAGTRMDMLTENFRMVTELCTFTNKLYKKGGVFIPMRAGGEAATGASLSTASDHSDSHPPSLPPTTDAPPLLTTTSLDTALTIPDGSHARNAILLPHAFASIELQLEAEARAVVHILRGFLTRGVDLNQPGTVMVVTPHRAQRSAVGRALLAAGLACEGVKVDTVERIQGGEADLVVVCYAFSGCASYHESTLAFTYHLPRLNVALSRARDTCILLTTRALLFPPITVAGTPDMRGALAHLWGFVHGAWVRQWADGAFGTSEVHECETREASVDDGDEEAAYGFGSGDEDAMIEAMRAMGV
ncbi:hypothetical protein DFJ77DRAFT_545863 [Powellomyces hirtus]|nr:hypothetical protein DFJ77DRAFT_545863 [Powellomyces hirtus]